MIKVTQHTIPQTDTEELKRILESTTNQKLIKLIEKELKIRESLGANKPLSIEDFL